MNESNNWRGDKWVKILIGLHSTYYYNFKHTNTLHWIAGRVIDEISQNPPTLYAVDKEVVYEVQRYNNELVRKYCVVKIEKVCVIF